MQNAGHNNQGNWLQVDRPWPWQIMADAMHNHIGAVCTAPCTMMASLCSDRGTYVYSNTHMHSGNAACGDTMWMVCTIQVLITSTCGRHLIHPTQQSQPQVVGCRQQILRSQCQLPQPPAL